MARIASVVTRTTTAPRSYGHEDDLRAGDTVATKAGVRYVIAREGGWGVREGVWRVPAYRNGSQRESLVQIPETLVFGD